MLESVKRAYDKKAFNEDLPCPINIETVEIYLQILTSAYKVSLGFQKNSSSISDLIPSFLKLLDIWAKLEVTPVAKRFCRLLISCVNHKFKYELNSSVYQVLIL